MFPELLRFSSSSRLLALVPEELRNAHHVQRTEAACSTTTATNKAASTSAFDLWEDFADNEHLNTRVESDDDDDDVDLSAMGF